MAKYNFIIKDDFIITGQFCQGRWVATC